jgi:hypothetical protein
MTAYSESGLKTAKNLALANNSSQSITPTVHRNYEEDQIDSSVNKVDGSYLRVVTSTAGTQPAYTATLTDKYPTAYSEDIPIQVTIHATSDASATFNINSIGAKKVYRPDNTLTQSGDLVADQEYIFNYKGDLDASAGGFRIVPGFGGGAGVPGSSTTLASGEHSSTTSSLTNVSAATVNSYYYSRVGNIVNFSIRGTTTPSGTGAGNFEIDIPIVSNFVFNYDAIGIIHFSSTNITDGYIRADPTNDTLELLFTIATASGTIPYYAVGQYEII